MVIYFNLEEYSWGLFKFLQVWLIVMVEEGFDKINNDYFLEFCSILKILIKIHISDKPSDNISLSDKKNKIDFLILEKLNDDLSKEIYYDPDINSNLKLQSTILPNLGINDKYFNILDWNPKEIAKQITLTTEYLYSLIETHELVELCNKTLLNKEKMINLTNLINRSFLLTNFINEEILTYDTNFQRATVIERFIELAKELYEMNNYNDFFTVILSLYTPCIINLTKTFSKVDLNKKILLEEYVKIISTENDYVNMKKDIHKKIFKDSFKDTNEYNPITFYTIEKEKIKEFNKQYCTPVIPYFGMIIKDLLVEYAKINNEFSNYVNMNSIINIHHIFNSFNLYKRQKHPFKPIFKLAFLSFPNISKEEDLLKLSMLLEPEFKFSTKKSFTKRFSTLNKYTDINFIFNNMIKYFNQSTSNKNVSETVNFYLNK